MTPVMLDILRMTCGTMLTAMQQCKHGRQDYCVRFELKQHSAQSCYFTTQDVQRDARKLTGCFMLEVTLIVLVPLVPDPPWLYM